MPAIVTMRGTLEGSSQVVCRKLPGGQILWAAFLSAPITTLALLEARPLLVFAVTDGQVGILSTATGRLELLEPTTLDGVPCVYLSPAAQGDQVVAGLLAGRIVVCELKMEPRHRLEGPRRQSSVDVSA